MTENEQYLYDHFLISVKSGFESIEDIIDGVLEAVEEEAWQSEISEDWVRETFQRAYEKNLTVSKTWQHPTDTERLHEVFDNLCREGIIALHNAGYTTSEAVYDVLEIWKHLEDDGLQPQGYCYYHGQDLERVIETDTLCVGFYGAKENNDKEAILIGHRVASAFKKAGFEVNWNESASRRIEIPNFNWQNVFVSDEDVEEKWGYDRVFRLMAK